MSMIKEGKLIFAGQSSRNLYYAREKLEVVRVAILIGFLVVGILSVSGVVPSNACCCSIIGLSGLLVGVSLLRGKKSYDKGGKEHDHRIRIVFDCLFAAILITLSSLALRGNLSLTALKWSIIVPTTLSLMCAVLNYLEDDIENIPKQLEESDLSDSESSQDERLEAGEYC